MSVRLRLLGACGWEAEGGLEPIAPDRPASLLIYLACRGDWVSREDVAFLYRPDVPDSTAQGYLRKLIHRARSLPWARGLEVTPRALRWIVDSDLRRFSSLIETGRLEEGLHCYRGEFLAGVRQLGVPGFDAWLELQRSELRSEWQRAAGRLAALLADQGEHERAAELYGAILRSDPLDEEAVQGNLSCLAAAGRRQEALRVYERFARLLAEELNSEPLDTTQALADSLRTNLLLPSEGDESDVGAPASHPSWTTSFVGREGELKRLRALLEGGDKRLVTLLGLGGSGKTRLALQTAEALRSRYRDGIGYVSFADCVPVEGQVASRVLESLELPRAPAGPEDALVASLRRREMLLVLDDFETVVECAPILPRLLRSVPGLTLLICSREALEVSGEWLFDVGGMDVPAAEGEPPDPERFDGVQLFIQRASRVDPGFILSRPNLSAITSICRYLEGLPLAIELAASWTRTLDCETLWRELRSNETLLTAAMRDLPARHHSVWAVLDYSLSSLPPESRKALGRLCVFRGGFDLRAAQLVAGASLTTLLALMNRTLVRRWRDGRYTLHSLVRQYALLDGYPEGAQEAHARYYCNLLQRLGPDLKGRDPPGALRVLHAEIENVEAAWRYAIDTADGSLLEGGMEALDYYFHYRSRWDDALRSFGEAVATLRGAGLDGVPLAEHAHARVIARLLLCLAHYERVSGKVTEAAEHAREAVQLLAQVGTPVDNGHAQMEFATAALAQARFDEARDRYRAVVRAGLENDDWHLVGYGYNGLGNIEATSDGDIALAESSYRKALEAHQRVGNLEGVNAALINLGACRFDVGDTGGAGGYWERSAEMARELGQAQREAVLLNNLGSLAQQVGDRSIARERFERSLEIRREIGDEPGVANVLHNLGRLSWLEGDHGAAEKMLEESLDLYLRVGDRVAEANVRCSLARVLAATGRVAESVECLCTALRGTLAVGVANELVMAIVAVCEVRESLGDHYGALRTALELKRGLNGDSFGLADRLSELIERLECPGERAGSPNGERTSPPHAVVDLADVEALTLEALAALP